MTIAIIAAMEKEAEFLRQSLMQREDRTFLNQTFTTGLLKGIHVVIAESGIGKVNAAKTTALIAAKFLPRAVINTGSAGGLASGLQQGDVIIGVEVAHFDVDVSAFGYQIGQVPRLTPRFTASKKLTAVASSIHADAKKGLIVSGDSFVHTEIQRDFILKNFPDAIAIEMEGAAIAQVCQTLEIPCIVIRAVSDLANGNSALSFDEFLPLAAENSAQMVAQIVEKIGLERIS